MIPRFDERQIICAVCKHPVDRVECYENPATLSRKFRVYCHGQTETAELDESTLAKANAITPGLAFNQKFIELPTPTPRIGN